MSAEPIPFARPPRATAAARPQFTFVALDELVALHDCIADLSATFQVQAATIAQLEEAAVIQARINKTLEDAVNAAIRESAS